MITATYGTGRANAYRLLEDALNLKDTKIYDTVMEDGVEKRILNKKETMLVQQKQEMIKSAFKDWIFKDIRAGRIFAGHTTNCLIAPGPVNMTEAIFSLPA